MEKKNRNDRELVDGVLAICRAYEGLDSEARATLRRVVELWDTAPVQDEDGLVWPDGALEDLGRPQVEAVLAFFESVRDHAHGDQCGAGIDLCDDLAALLKR